MAGCKPDPNELIGKRFGRLVVIDLSAEKHMIKGTHWNCLCDCGGTTCVSRGYLVTGGTKSCGCLRLELLTVHGLYKSPEYAVWEGMKQRCYNPKCDMYENYGGRGIKVCDRWLDVAMFYSDMGPRPSPKHSIERLNNDGDYEPVNCIWATRDVQVRNMRQTVMITAHGKTQCLTDWAGEIGVDRQTIIYRLRTMKLSPDEALTDKYHGTWAGYSV